MSAVDGRLARLRDATEVLTDAGAVAELVARSLAGCATPGLALAYTMRGLPAREVGAVQAYRGSEAVAPEVLAEFRRAFAVHQVFFDRAQVPRSQRGAWFELPGDWFRASSFSRIFRCGSMSRLLLCVGARPLACIGWLSREPATGPERQRLSRYAAAAAVPLRAAALVAEAGPHLDAIEGLLSERAEPVVLLSHRGVVLGASPKAESLLRDGALLDRLRDVVRSGLAHPQSVTSLGDEPALHVTPCTRRGASSAYLVFVDPPPGMGRAGLTGRQMELLHLLNDGLTNGELAQRMGIEVSTVKTMLERLYRRAGVSGRVALLRWASRGQPHGRTAALLAPGSSPP